MMLESIENGPLVYPTVKEEGQIQKKKYAELTKQEKLQDDCDVQAIKIVLQGLPPDVYALVNHYPGITDCHDIQPTIIQNAAFQTDDLDAYDFDCDDISSAKAVLMANLLSYDENLVLKAELAKKEHMIEKKFFDEVEVLVYVTTTCPSLAKLSEKLVAVTPLNKSKKVRFTEPAASSSNTHQQIAKIMGYGDYQMGNVTISQVYYVEGL
nr:hypothetical protein [Tanacetum cinerariifolium]